MKFNCVKLVFLIPIFTLLTTVIYGEDKKDKKIDDNEKKEWYDSPKLLKLTPDQIHYVNYKDTKDLIYVYRRDGYTQVDYVSNQVKGWGWTVLSPNSLLTDTKSGNKYLVHSVKSGVPLGVVFVYENISDNSQGVLWTEYYPSLEEGVIRVDYYSPSHTYLLKEAGIVDIRLNTLSSTIHRNIDVIDGYNPPYKVYNYENVDGEVITLDPNFKIPN